MNFNSFYRYSRLLNVILQKTPRNVKMILKIRQSIIKYQLFGTYLAFIWPTISKEELTIDTKNSVLTNADYLFENGQYEQCRNLLRESENFNNVEVQWRLCRVLYNMSKEPGLEANEKKALILEAYNIIEGQLSNNYDNYVVQKWYALLLDSKSSQEGIKERISQLENVKKHMDLAVTINPNDATTLHMLGEWCYQITELPWHQRKIAQALFASPPRSTYEDALEYFLRAETVEPRFYSLNLLRIGNCYLRLNKADQAKYYLQLAASYPVKTNDDLKAQTEATALLQNFK